MANRQNMGVAGDVQVNFKIGRKYSFTHRLVVCENLTRPFILGTNFMSQHYMKLGWAPVKKRTLGYLNETIAVASQEVTNEPLVLRLEIVQWYQHTVHKCFGGRSWQYHVMNWSRSFQIYM